MRIIKSAARVSNRCVRNVWWCSWMKVVCVCVNIFYMSGVCEWCVNILDWCV